jgi:galactokinase
MVELHLLDLHEVHTWDLDALPQPGPRAYWLAALHVARQEGWLPEAGWRAEVTSAIPQQAGASSSSALTAAWCALIAARAGRALDREWVAHATWRVEVEFFDEPGGMMDQVMCAMGGTRSVHFHPGFRTQSLPCPPGHWLLIDSQQPKDTLGILARAKHQRLALLEAWGASLHGAQLPHRPAGWSADEHRLMDATIGIQCVSDEGRTLLEQGEATVESIGALLTAHHRWLSEGIEVSTARIDALLQQAAQLGACGGKINGSGGGGTAFAVFPEGKRDAAAEAFRAKGVRVIPVELGVEGVRVEVN